ncbi:hypothetical protein HDE_06972 [Halotydeus destructor]|nr:hypothetical protein HDE_06972 [Halotydeus destructor]
MIGFLMASNGISFEKHGPRITRVISAVYYLKMAFCALHIVLYVEHLVSGTSLLDVSVYSLQVTIGGITTYIYRKKVDDIRKLFSYIDSQKPNGSRGLLRLLSIMWAIFVLADCIGLFIATCYRGLIGIKAYLSFHNLNLHNTLFDMVFVVVDVITFCNWIPAWLVGSQLVYFYFQISLSMVYRDGCMSLTEDIALWQLPQANAKNEIRKFRLMRASYCTMRDKLEDMLSVLPFLCYGQMFFETSARVLRYMDVAEDNDAETLVNLFDYAMPLFGMTVIAVMFDDSIMNQRQLEKGIRNALVRLDGPTAVANLRNEIARLECDMNQGKIRSPTAWDFFNVDKQMILSYAGALLPFTLMLVNLGDMKQN